MPGMQSGKCNLIMAAGEASIGGRPVVTHRQVWAAEHSSNLGLALLSTHVNYLFGKFQVV